MRTKRSKATDGVFMIGGEEYERDQREAIHAAAVEQDELTEFIDTTRAAVLEALDGTVTDGKGWRDGDLAKLFVQVDKIARRNFTRRK